MALKKVCIIIGTWTILHNIAILLEEPMEDDRLTELEIMAGQPFVLPVMLTGHI